MVGAADGWSQDSAWRTLTGRCDASATATSVHDFEVVADRRGHAVRNPAIEPQANSPAGLLLNGPFVTLLTWGILVLELVLFMGLVVPKSQRKWLLIAGVSMHAGIMVLHGSVSFGLVMFAALILYLRPFEEVFSVARPLLSSFGLANYLRRIPPRPARAELADS